MIDTLTITHHQDAGHGWLEVSRALLADLGIAGNITAYSYVQGDTVYLEEDCDAGTLLKAMDAAGRPFAIVGNDHGNYSPIRNLASYRR